jgi:nitrous oxide reductase accessory protein NosL
MKVLISAVLGAAFLAGCTTGEAEVKPIPGSITYNGQPRTKLTMSPPGSVIKNSFYDSRGIKVLETYILQPDRTLKLTRREYIPDLPL